MSLSRPQSSRTQLWVKVEIETMRVVAYRGSRAGRAARRGAGRGRAAAGPRPSPSCTDRSWTPSSRMSLVPSASRGTNGSLRIVTTTGSALPRPVTSKRRRARGPLRAEAGARDRPAVSLDEDVRRRRARAAARPGARAAPGRARPARPERAAWARAGCPAEAPAPAPLGRVEAPPPLEPRVAVARRRFAARARRASGCRRARGRRASGRGRRRCRGGRRSARSTCTSR